MNATNPLAPAAAVGNALVGPLAAATLVTSDMDRCRRFYCDLMGLESALDPLPEKARAPLTRLWGLEDAGNWEHALYQQPNSPDMPFLRVIAVPGERPAVRPGMNALLEGGLAVGFACADMERLIAESERMGFGTVAGVTRIPLHRPDGSPYEALETHLRAPDDVYVLGIARPSDLAPICPIAEGGLTGGPAYSSQVINNGQRSLDFYTEVLGYEVRRDVQLPSEGPTGGLLGVPPGSNMRFLQVFAPGSESRYLVFLDWSGAGADAVAPSRPPSRGMVMWSFIVQDLDAVLARAERFGAERLCAPEVVDARPVASATRRATLAAPNGFAIELIEEIDG
ncbi:MAG: hypothetical protein OXE51_00850 [Gammaproteobacteria bacterium]|nr:hypothetical protein [Gammaproteobacteria bacterium]